MLFRFTIFSLQQIFFHPKRTHFSRSPYMPFQVKQILPYLKKSNQTHYRLLPWTKQCLWQSVSNRLISLQALLHWLKKPHRQSPRAQILVGCYAPLQSSIKPRVWLPGISSIPNTYRTELLQVGRSADLPNFSETPNRLFAVVIRTFRHG